ncbi:MAG: PhoPQ-activated pathogenicity-related family protein [Verrucomicrobiae bacterium]|nr:PhoPQ-activated pathogenicity-related family protein [Verrucomicrobiae bacterium]
MRLLLCIGLLVATGLSAASERTHLELSVSNQQPYLILQGGTGRWHRIETSTNLLTWLRATAFPQTNPASLWADLTATNLPQRFYRARDVTTALDTYVARPDTNYGWALSNTIVGPGAQTTFVFDMRSQEWLTTNEVNRTLWRHWLILVKPTTVTNRHALLVLSGGSNPGSLPTSADARLRQIATNTRTIVAELKMIPNQPLTFAGESFPRSEDSLIAYAWDKFLRTGDERWPPRLPMTKAAVRAMDTITAFCATPTGGSLTVDRFVVAGASKRGWTTWTTAIVDRRVVAIVPIVIDLLNLEPSFAHHYRAYGFWAPAIQDYVDMGIPNWFGTPQFRALMELVEPYEYRERLALPKLLINATGDEFFLPDSARFYFDDLPGVKYLRYVPNTGHSLSGSDYPDTLEGFYQSVLFNVPLPRFTWTLQNSNSIRVVAEDLPTEARLWQATNPTARDFRHPVIGPAWTSTVLPHQGSGVFVGIVSVPPQGWKAFFVELTYVRGGGLAPLKLTTQVYVVPDTLPYQFPP